MTIPRETSLNRSKILMILGTFILSMFTFQLWAVERFPPPEFESGYTFPSTSTPQPRANYLEYVDFLVLVVCLSLGSYIITKRRSRREIYFLTLFSVAYFGFWRKGCICAIGSIQNIALSLFNSSYAVPITVLGFFIVPILFALFFGRVFCSGVCPLGAIQDIVLLRPIKIPDWLESSLSFLKYVYLAFAVVFAATGSAFIICEFDPFVSIFRRSGNFLMVGLGVVFLAIGLFIGRPYCRFFCPYGAILGIVSRFSKWPVVLSPTDCLLCKICDIACPYGAIKDPAKKVDQSYSHFFLKLATLIAIGTIFCFVGAYAGKALALPFSKVHPVVRLAEQIAAEDSGKNIQPTDESKAFRQGTTPTETLYANAFEIRSRFQFGGIVAGIFLGLVAVFKIAVQLFPQPPSVYEPDPVNCVACGRCFTFCPREIVIRKRLNSEFQLTQKTEKK